MLELISVHVPKTAGITFGRVLTSVYGEDRVLFDLDNIYPGDIDPRYRVVHGHFCVGKFHGLMPEARRIAWLRHPVSWIVSMYYFTRHITVIPGQHLQRRLQEEDLSLLEFAEHPLTRNHFTTQYMLGLDIEAFFFVGIHEHFREDLIDLQSMLAWPEVVADVLNANPEPGYSDRTRAVFADPALVKRLASFFEADMALYERALKLRERRRRGRRRRLFVLPWARRSRNLVEATGQSSSA